MEKKSILIIVVKYMDVNLDQRSARWYWELLNKNINVLCVKQKLYNMKEKIENRLKE
jgi:hypothetical protein